MLSPIKVTVAGEEVEISCRHATVWPPGWSRLGVSATALRAEGRFTAQQYERAKTWERVCGLPRMNSEKCPTCPHALGPDKEPIVPGTPKVPYHLQPPRGQRNR